MSDREYDPHCPECVRRLANLRWETGDFAALKRKARSAYAPVHGFANRLAEGKARVENAVNQFEAHVVEAHPDGFPDRPRKVKGVRKYRGNKVPCPLCGKRVGPTLRRDHVAPSGASCPGVPRKQEFDPAEVTDAPPVDLRQRVGMAEHYAAKKGECRECHRWLPGERTICGRCSRLRESA